MRYAPGMLLIGSTGRNAGKTLLACGLLARYAGQGTPLAAGKVTAVQERDGTCPRGGAGCGVCSTLTGAYCLTEETERGGSKDTQRLLTAGAERVHWLRVLKAHLEEGAERLLSEWGNRPAVCESNSLRAVVEPGVFVMCRPADDEAVKASAASVLAEADCIVTFDGDAHDGGLDRFFLQDGAWQIRQDAGLVVMGTARDAWRALEPHFDATSYARGVLDGPGLLRGLEGSRHAVNLVGAGDGAVPGPRLVRRLFRALRQGYDAAAPSGPGAPGCVVCHRRVLGRLEAALAEGRTGVSELLSCVRTAMIDEVE